MWIRSQDRKILTEIHDVEIDIGCKVWGSGTLIGKYSTEEKALAVLDEIQGKIECSYQSRVTPAFGTNCYCLSEKGKFYQMPQDDEIEI